MDIIAFLPGRAPQRLAPGHVPPPNAFIWIDVNREEAEWHRQASEILGIDIDERHLHDSSNTQHPPYFDGTPQYEMLVFRSLSPDARLESPTTQPVTFFVQPDGLISVRSATEPSIDSAKNRLLEGMVRPPQSPASLLHLLLNRLTNRFLALREPLSLLVEDWQSRLLSSGVSFKEWNRLLELRNQIHRLEITCQGQLDALTSWREDTQCELVDHLSVRFNDLNEHLSGVARDMQSLEHFIESLVQIYFSATSQRTNEIVRVLTLISAIFLPLNLIAGLFGMNFQRMPLIGLTFGPWLVLGVMACVAALLLLLFRGKRWF